MSILKRFKDIMAANINALLDKAEDPAKMADQYLRDLKDDFSKVKAETAAVMAAETRAKRELDENDEEIEKMMKYAEKALLAGNEEDAKTFLAKKQDLEKRKETLEAQYELARQNAVQMRQMHDKLERDIATLEERKAQIKQKIALAKAKEKAAQTGASKHDVTGSLAAFDRMEEKADQMLDQANALAELNASDEDEENAESLMAKYDQTGSTDAAVESDLAALKAKLGME